MQFEPKDIMEGLQQAATALHVANSLDKKMTEGFNDIKNSVRYDIQNVVTQNIKLSILEALKEHNQEEVKPIKEKADNAVSRLNTLDAKIKIVRWMGYGFAVFVAWLSELPEKFLEKIAHLF